MGPVTTGGDKLPVRTVLEPHRPYPPARAAVDRHDELPPWLLRTWEDAESKAMNEDLDVFEDLKRELEDELSRSWLGLSPSRDD